MLKNEQNKMIGNDAPDLTNKSKSEQKRIAALKGEKKKRTFSFPALGITVEADTYEEALEKIKQNKK